MEENSRIDALRKDLNELLVGKPSQDLTFEFLMCLDDAIEVYHLYPGAKEQPPIEGHPGTKDHTTVKVLDVIRRKAESLANAIRDIGFDELEEITRFQLLARPLNRPPLLVRHTAIRIDGQPCWRVKERKRKLNINSEAYAIVTLPMADTLPSYDILGTLNALISNIDAGKRALSELKDAQKFKPERLWLAINVAACIRGHFSVNPGASREGLYETVLHVVLRVATGDEPNDVHDLACRAINFLKVKWSDPDKK